MKDQESIEVDVLIVGGGGAGLTAALLLAKQDVDFLLVSHYPGTSHLPKAHVLYQKTMEIFDELGIADAVNALGTPPEHMRYNGWYAGFAGPGGDWGRQITRIECWGAGAQHTAWLEASPRLPTNLPQIRLEPLMKARADELSPGRIRFNNTLISLQQDSTGVTAIIEDRASNKRYSVRAKYLLGCDGGRTVGPAVGIALEGPDRFANQISVVFSADLSKWVSDDPEVLIRVIKNPETGEDGILVPMGGDCWGPRSREWACGVASPPDVEISDAEALRRVKALLGLPDLEMTVHRYSRWAMEGLVADKMHVGRVFVLGDAAHRHPPTGGLGLNTAIQDAYNLCWKLGAVLRGQAAPALLDSYEQERLPVANLVVDTAVQNALKLLMFNQTIGFMPEMTADERWTNLRAMWERGPETAEARRRMFEYFATTRTEFDSLNITFGYTYQSDAIVADGDLPLVRPEDVSIYRPTTKPGASVPASELRRWGETSSIEQLTGHGRYVLIAGEDGEGWRAAGHKLAEELGLPLDVVLIGDYETDWIDWRFEWTKKREISTKGAVLVRPDRFIAWRSMNGSRQPYDTLKAALSQILATN